MVDSFGGASPLRLAFEKLLLMFKKSGIHQLRERSFISLSHYLQGFLMFFAGSLPSIVLNHKGSRSRLAGQK